MVNREPEHSESWPSELDVEFKELRSPRARSKVSDFSEEDRELVLSATRQQILERVADHLHEVDRFPTARAFDSTFAEHARVTLTVLRWAFGTYAEFTAELSTLIGHTMDPGKRVPRTTIQIGSGTDGLALSKIVYKYFDLTDQFLRIRVVDPEAIQLIEGLGKVSRLGKSDYRSAVLEATVVGWLDEVRPGLINGYPDDNEAAEEHLYRIAIEVNPRLEIHQVSIPPAGSSVDFKSEQRTSKQSITPEKQLEVVHELREVICERVIGQEAALHKIEKRLVAACHGFGKANNTKPLGVFLLLGPTGVGKTYTGKVLSQELFAGNMLRYNFNQCALAHEYATIIGAPPGYAGHDDGNTIVDRLGEVGGEAVILIDEVEKGHKNAHQMLLDWMDEGVITDNAGRSIALDKTVLILTSNVGSKELAWEGQSMNWNTPELSVQGQMEVVDKDLRFHFSSEFLARLQVVHYEPLVEEHGKQIAQLELENCVADADFSLSWDDSLLSHILDKCEFKNSGARGFRAYVLETVAFEACAHAYRHKVKRGQTLKVTVRDGELKFRVAGRKRRT